MIDKSHLTAIGRKKPSAPIVYLLDHCFVNILNHHTLDFGCGRGYDAKTFMFDKYDPHFFPTVPFAEQYDRVVCNYVLNVIPKEEEAKVIKNIKACLKPGGIAYITVRRDIKKEGYTSKGTFQRHVFLPYPKVREDSNFCIYEVKK